MVLGLLEDEEEDEDEEEGSEIIAFVSSPELLLLWDETLCRLFSPAAAAEVPLFLLFEDMEDTVGHYIGSVANKILQYR